MSRKKYLDRLDIELLNALKKNPSFTVQELGNEVDLSPGPTHTRLSKLSSRGFYKNLVDIDYSKFGVYQNVFSFRLEGNPTQKTQFDPQRDFDSIVNILSKAKESLITSIELLKEEKKDKYSVSIYYFNRYTEKTIRQRDSKSKNDNKTPSDKDEIKNLLKDYIPKNSATMMVIKKQEVYPELDRGHVIRKKLD